MGLAFLQKFPLALSLLHRLDFLRLSLSKRETLSSLPKSLSFVLFLKKPQLQIHLPSPYTLLPESRNQGRDMRPPLLVSIGIPIVQ